MSTVPPIPMFSPDGKLKLVPNHLIDEATKQGGQPAVVMIGQDGTKKYVPKNQVRNFLSQGATLAPIEEGPSTKTIAQNLTGIHPSSNPILQGAAGLGRAALGVVEAPYTMAKAAFAPPTSPEEVAASSQGPTALLVDRSVVQPAEKAASLAKQYWTSGHPILAGLSALGALPVIGPMGQAAGERMAAGDIPGAVTESAANALMMGAPDVAPGAAKKVISPALRRGAEIISGTGTRPAEGLVERTAAENKIAGDKYADAVREHGGKVREAEHETRGREIGYRRDLKQKAEDIAAQDKVSLAKRDAEHQKAVDEVRQHNERVRAKHAAISKRIGEENAAQENMLNLRRQKEAELQQATDAYRAQEDIVDKTAKSAENKAWGAWRTKMKGATIDGAEITAPLGKLRLDSPEVDRTLRQLEPMGDEVPQESPYARLRDATAREHYGTDYNGLSPMKRDSVDAMMSSAGESPEPIDLNPEDGQPISVERVQRANSILQRYIRSGRFEGPLLGEMKQVSRVLRNAVSRASEEHGAGDDLDNARAETVRYQEAFGRERPEPRTVRGEREKTANPEEVKRLQEEERLEAVRKYAPSLADAQEQVRNLRDEVRKLPSEDELRKSRKQVPPPPTINDTREVFRLKEEPRPAPRALTSGSAAERAAQTVTQPERVPPPSAPRYEPPKTIGSEEVQAAKAKALKDRINLIRRRGEWIATGAAGYGVLESAMRGQLGRIPRMVAEGILAVSAVAGIAKFLESPAVREFLTKATPADVAKIPPAMRGSFDPVLFAARQEGIPLSRALLPILVAGGQTQPVPGPKLPPSHPLRKFSPLQ